MSTLEIVSRPLAMSPLAEAGTRGDAREWFAAIPTDAHGWWQVAEAASEDRGDWRSPLAPAFDARGPAAERLRAAAVVVTTGQQPGLFGGPLYTFTKALSALALADALQDAIGLPVAPVFWAATDDSDLAEACHVAIVDGDRPVDLVANDGGGVTGATMAATPLGDVTAALSLIERACGSAPVAGVVELLRRAYARREATVGSAYVALMRGLLEPLGIAVLDAAHPAVRAAAAPTLALALERGREIAEALSRRDTAVRAAGFTPQVALVGDLSLVFESDERSVRRRIPIGAAPASDVLTPNVLLRPVVERAILPTVTYVGGPGEVAYFAQVSAVAEAMALARPRVVPRWSGTVVEPRVRDALELLRLRGDELAAPDAVASVVARGELQPEVRRALTALRSSIAAESGAIVAAMSTDEQLARSVGSARARMEWQIARIERRLAARVKQGDSRRMRALRLAQASLYPFGRPQERVLSFVPFLARHGVEFTDGVRAAALEHARSLVARG